jgi:hypothetical protein
MLLSIYPKELRTYPKKKKKTCTRILIAALFIKLEATNPSLSRWTDNCGTPDDVLLFSTERNEFSSMKRYEGISNSYQ